MHQIFSDVKSNTDLLNRQPFAAGIARTLFYALPDQNESFVFGLNGRWGSGKSTLLHFVKKEIERLHEELKNDRFEIFEFNPWMFSGQEQLQRAFLGELFKKLGGRQGKLRELGKRFSDLIKPFTPPIGDAKGVIDWLEREDPLEDVKKAVDSLLINERFRLYVIMDDLDRLTPEEITHVFQLVKLNANFKNTVFLLAYDKDIVVNAVEQKFKDNGERYLAKIVQVDYTLPEMLEEELEAIFFERLDDFFKKQNIFYFSGDLKPYWSKYGLKNYFRTLRDVYRYINGLAFRLPEIYKEINITHFLILEAFRVFEFETYQRLYFECNESLRRFQKFPEFLTQEGGNNFSLSSLELIRVLKQNPDPEYFKQQFECGRELFHSDYFERYFALRISQKDLPTNDFNRFMSNTEFGAHWLSEVHKAGRFDNLLRKLSMPELKKEMPKVEVAPIRELIRFLDTQLRHNSDDCWVSILGLTLVIINFLRIAKKNENITKQIWDELMSECDYPQYTKFLLLDCLYSKLKDKESPFFGSRDLASILQPREFEVKEIMRSFIHRNSDRFNIDLITTKESSFASSFISVYAEVESTIYPDFIFKRFTRPDQMAWLLQIVTNFADEDQDCSWITDVAPLILPQPVCDYLYKNLKHFIQEVDNEKTPPLPERRMKEIRFFLNEYSENMTESMKIPF